MKKMSIKLFIAIMCVAGYAPAQIVTTLAGSGVAADSNGVGSAACLNRPTGVATDGVNVYVVGQGNQVMQVVISTGVVTTIAGSGVAGSTDGTGTAATFSDPTGVVVDGSGNLYVADALPNKIRKVVIATGVVTTLAGSGAKGSANGIGTAATFWFPTGLTLDGKGNLYVIEKFNNEVRKIVLSTGAVTTIAGGTNGSADGIGTAASFNYPTGIAYDGNGNLFIADDNNNEIRKVVIATAAVTTLAGQLTYGSANGTGTTAGFHQPWGLGADGKGNLYIADEWNYDIRQIVISSAAVTTLAGTGVAAYADGAGTAASFSSPEGVVADGNGNLFVADEQNNRIRQISLVTGINEINTANEASVYPNPVARVLYVRPSKPLQGATQIKIMDVSGKQIMVSHINNPQQLLSVDVSSLSVGMYFLQITGNDGSKELLKFVKQ
jgi:hypothetical protein